MKHLFTAALLLLASLSFASSYEMYLSQLNATADNYIGLIVQDTGTNGILGYTQSTHTPSWWALGSGLTLSNGTLSVTAAPRVQPTFNTGVSRTLNTSFQLSTTTYAWACYRVDINVTSPLLAGSQGTASLQYADDAAFTTNVKQAISGTNATAGVLNVVNTGSVSACGYIPAGKWARIKTTIVSGNPTFTLNTADNQEGIFN
jgi:hypothetical protein